jgi:hypothetical protein
LLTAGALAAVALAAQRLHRNRNDVMRGPKHVVKPGNTTVLVDCSALDWNAFAYLLLCRGMC